MNNLIKIDKKSKNIIKKTTDSIALMGLSSIVNILLRFLITIVLARLLSPNEFGNVAALGIIISFAEIFRMLGIGPAIVQKKNLMLEDIITGNTITICLGVITYAIIFALSPLLIDILNTDNVLLLRVLAIVFIINSISAVSESLLQRKMRFNIISLSNIISYGVGYGLFGIIFAYRGLGVWALVIGQIVQALIKSLISIIAEPVELKFRIYKTPFKELIYFSGGVTMANIFNNIALQGDYIIVTTSLGTQALGVYKFAYSLLSMPASIIGKVLDQVLFPVMSKYQNDIIKLKNGYLFCITMIASITLPLIVVLYSLSSQIILVLLGDKWIEVIPPFKILVLSLYFRTSYKISDTLAKALGAVYKRAWRQLIYAICIVAGAYIGKFWGVSGVATGVTFAIIVNYIIMQSLSLKLLDIKIFEYLKGYVPILIISGIIFFVASKLVEILEGTVPSLLTIIIVGLSSSALYTIAFIALGFKMMPSNIKDLFKLILKNSFIKT